MNAITRTVAAEPHAPARPSVRFEGDRAVVEGGAHGPVALDVVRTDDAIRLVLPAGRPSGGLAALAAVAEALTALARDTPPILIACDDRETAALLRREGLVVLSGGALVLRPELLWQRAEAWLPEGARPAFPQFHVVTDGRRHPVRAPKPEGVVYARHIPWLDKTLTFRALDMERDLPVFHRWMNDPRVDVVWEEAGDLDAHRRSLQERAADPHLLTLIGAFDGVPFGYFELYWAKENRIGPHYDADDHDRGWHVLIGEDAFRGRGCITAWLPSLMHYMFLDDPRTQRIVGEPRSTHAQQIRNLDKAGFAKVKHFDFPHKRALLVMLLRERFFGDRLWAPEA